MQSLRTKGYSRLLTSHNPLHSTFKTTPIRLSSPLSPPVLSQLSRTMSTKYTKPEWLVIAPDFEGALENRLSVRPTHMTGLKEDPDDFWLWGGAMLEEPIKEGDSNPPKMKGSAMLIGADSKEEVIERLKKDVYVSGKVWDWEKVQIIPFKSAVRKPL